MKKNTSNKASDKIMFDKKKYFTKKIRQINYEKVFDKVCCQKNRLQAVQQNIFEKTKFIK